MLMISPSCSLRWSGMPWQITSLTDLRRSSVQGSEQRRPVSKLPRQLYNNENTRTCTQTWGSGDSPEETGTRRA